MIFKNFDEYKKTRVPEIEAEMQAAKEAAEQEAAKKAAEEAAKKEQIEADKVAIKNLNEAVYSDKITREAAFEYFKKVIADIPVQDIDIEVNDHRLTDLSYGFGKINLPDTEMQKILSIFSGVQDVDFKKLGLYYKFNDETQKNFLTLHYSVLYGYDGKFKPNIMTIPIPDALKEAIINKKKEIVREQEEKTAAESSQENIPAKKNQIPFGRLFGKFKKEKEETVETVERDDR